MAEIVGRALKPPAARAITIPSYEGAKGVCRYSFPPPAIGEGIADFSATIVLEQDAWVGKGSFTYGGHHVDDVPLTLDED